MPTLLEVFAQIIATHHGNLDPDKNDYALAKELLTSDEIQSLKTWIQSILESGFKPPNDLSGLTLEFFQYL